LHDATDRFLLIARQFVPPDHNLTSPESRLRNSLCTAA
jgi:hypothetical protein